MVPKSKPSDTKEVPHKDGEDKRINTPEPSGTKTQTRVTKGGKAQTMDDLLSTSGHVISGFKKGDIIQGTITRVSPREILVDIGGKSEGVVIDRELESYKDMLMSLQPGDTVTAQIIVEENDRGQSVLSLRKNMLDKRWSALKDHEKAGGTVQVTVKDVVRGGLLVDYGGLRGYIPQSQIEQSVYKSIDKGAVRILEVKVVEVDADTNRLIFSQRAVAEEAAFAKQKEVIDVIHEGDVVEAQITGVVPFGAFAKLKVEKDKITHEIEGLIHISEIAWEKVEDPTQHVKTGDTIKVKILNIDKDTGKVTLSIKQLMPDPWEHVLDIFEKDTQVKGAVTRVTPYGVFVSLSPGIEGLIHISKITPGEEPQQGDEVTCLIEDVQPEKRKISLSLALTEKPIGYR